MENKFIPVCEPMLAGNELKYVTDCVSTGWISSAGKYVDEFEKLFAVYCEAKYSVAVSNGTVAIHLALKALEIGSGDEVIIPSFTMIASAAAVCYTGAMPVFVDVDKDTWNIDPTQLESKITAKTKAIMVVSVFGNPCDMDSVYAIAKKNNLKVIEDAAESHGALYKGKKVGSLADITTFSFFANKNLTTGEGGMVLTDDIELYKKVKYYKNLCFSLDAPRNYIHEDVGFNYRISNIHAAIGLAQTEKADDYKAMRIKNGKLYESLLENVPGVVFQKVNEGDEKVYWMNAIVIIEENFGKTRDELVQHLKQNQIDTRVLFVGMHQQPGLLKYGCKPSGDFNNTEFLTKNGFYLPSASSLTEAEITHICSIIKNFQTQ